MIGLCGANRVGKSTLAKAYSEKYGVSFVATTSSQVFQKLGLDPKVDYDFATRIGIQNAILDAAEALWKNAKDPFVTDRTPIDMLAYTMADVQRQNVQGRDLELFMEYMDRCIFATNRHFGVLMLVQPGIALVEEEGKAPANPAYMEHLNSLMLGLLVDARIEPAHFHIPRAYLDLDKRVACLNYAVSVSIDRHEAVVEKNLCKGVYLQ